MVLIDKLAWIEIQDGKILSTRSRGKDKWYIPGGKREAGESDIQALVREIREELTVELLPSHLSFLGEWQAQAHGHPAGTLVQMRCYTGPYSGELTPSAEIAAFGWLDMSDWDQISPVDQKIFTYLQAEGLLL